MEQKKDAKNWMEGHPFSCKRIKPIKEGRRVLKKRVNLATRVTGKGHRKENR